MNFEKDYAELIQHTLDNGKVANGRNGATISTFGKSLTIDMTDSLEFPLLWGRKMYPKGIVGEFVTFLQEPKNLTDFERNNCNYWSKWAEPETGQLELDYGNAWTNYNGVNQLQDVINQLINNPHSRRILINAWRPDRVLKGELSLPCCHYAYQWHVTDDGHLDMIWIQRSVDLMIGLPSDIVLAAVWNIMLAHLTGYKPGDITMQLGDCHVYEEHILGALEYLKRVRTACSSEFSYPSYTMNNINSYSEFSNNTIKLTDYQPQDTITFELKA